jgi:hypothetical protein
MSEAAKASLRQRAEKEARDFFVVFSYIWFLLAILSLHKSIVLFDALSYSIRALSAGVAAFAALIPFFGLSELSKAIVEKPLQELFFRKRIKFVPAPDETGREPKQGLLKSAE